MSKTLVSGQESWQQDIPSQPRILTTSDTVGLTQMEGSTKTEVESRLLFSVLASVITSVIISYVVAILVFNHVDGMARSGYFPVTYKQGDVVITAMVPMYMTEEERRKTIWGKK